MTIKRYDLVDYGHEPMGEYETGKYIKRADMIEALAHAQVDGCAGPVEVDRVRHFLGIDEEEFGNALHAAEDAADPEPAEYRGDR